MANGAVELSHSSPFSSAIPEITTRTKTRATEGQSRIIEPNATIRRNKSLVRNVANPQTRNGIQVAEASEATAYRLSCTAAGTASSTVSSRLPLIVKPLRQYQLTNENLHNFKDFKCTSENGFTTSRLPVASSSVPQVPEAAPQSSRVLHKSLSANSDFKQIAVNPAGSVLIDFMSKYEPDSLITIKAKKVLCGVNSSPYSTCTARAIYCESKPTCGTAVLPQDTTASPRETAATKMIKIPSPYTCVNNLEKSNIDIDWKTPKCGFRAPVTALAAAASADPALKVSRLRRSTVACSAHTEWSQEENRRNCPLIAEKQREFSRQPDSSIPSGTSSLKRKISKELPKKPWFSSSVDGPLVESQIAACAPVRETAIDDDLPPKRQISLRRGGGVLGLASIQGSRISRIRRMTQTSPPKPARTYQETLDDSQQSERLLLDSNQTIRAIRKPCPVMGTNTKLVVPKEYNSSRDHSNDSELGSDFRKDSADAVENKSETCKTGKWLLCLDLPCDPFCSAHGEFIMPENSLIRFLFK